MKKIILAITVAAFTVGGFAGEACCNKDKATAADKEKAAASSCPAAKEAAKCPATGATAQKDAEKKPAEAPKSEQAKKS